MKSIQILSLRAVFLIAVTLLFTSCYTHRLATEALPGTVIPDTAISDSYFWGLWQDKPIETRVCDSLDVLGVAEVQIKTNFLYALITVATLGIWSPVKVIWRCSEQCPHTGIIN